MYFFLLDSEKVNEAGIALDEAFVNIDHVDPQNRINLWLERAYFLSLYRNSIDEAQNCLDQVSLGTASLMQQLRAESALSFSKQNWQEAKDKAQAALEDFKLLGKPITARKESEQLQDLLARAETNLQASMLTGQ